MVLLNRMKTVLRCFYIQLTYNQCIVKTVTVTP